MRLEPKGRTINWPFAVIVALAVAAIIGRFVLVHDYSVPRIFRHHLADFGFVALFTMTITIILAPFRSKHVPESRHERRLASWTLVPIIGTVTGLWVEFEDYLGLDDDDGGFDPGVITEWLGAPNTDTFDWWDVLAISVGGIVVLILYRMSLRSIDKWAKFPLLMSK